VNVATGVLVVLAAALLVYAWRRGDGSHVRGVSQAWLTLRQTLPLLLAAFAIVGYVTVLFPREAIEAWIGPTSGWQGLLIAEGVGMLLPGGPYIVFPLIAALYRAGAGVGPAVSLTASWATLALLNVSFEIPFMGWRFTAVRWPLALLVPVLSGAAARALFGA
jgi:uncharacterized membrane protein YraQ (UPF0718 family)